MLSSQSPNPMGYPYWRCQPCPWLGAGDLTVALAPGMALIDDGKPRFRRCSAPALAVSCPRQRPDAPSVARWQTTAARPGAGAALRKAPRGPKSATNRQKISKDGSALMLARALKVAPISAQLPSHASVVTAPPCLLAPSIFLNCWRCRAARRKVLPPLRSSGERRGPRRVAGLASSAN